MGDGLAHHHLEEVLCSHMALLSWSSCAVDQYSLVNKCSATFTHPFITTSLPNLVANDTHDDDEM